MRRAQKTPQCYQFYFHRDRGLNRAMMQSAREAGVEVMMLTVDSITGGNRERDLRTGFTIPFRLTLGGMCQFAVKPRWGLGFLTHDRFSLPQLDAQVADLTGQLKNIDDSWKNRVQGMQETLDSRKKLIDELEARNKALNEQLDQSQSQLRDTQARLGDENKQVMMRYMVYGGSIAGAGLLAGLILPSLTRGRRKNDRWF